jgi:hypothetical protein
MFESSPRILTRLAFGKGRSLIQNRPKQTTISPRKRR